MDSDRLPGRVIRDFLEIFMDCCKGGGGREQIDFEVLFEEAGRCLRGPKG